MLTTPFFAALGVAAWSKFLAKHNARVSVLYFLTVFLLLWFFLSLTPKVRAQDEQKSVEGFSVTGSGAP
jgi:hypothetical protein